MIRIFNLDYAILIIHFRLLEELGTDFMQKHLLQPKFSFKS